MSTKTQYLYSSFSSGEITPKLGGNTTLAQFFEGCHELTNWIPVPQGGVTTRGGFHFVYETKDNGIARLIPFRFSELQNYILEFSDTCIRFFKDGGIVMDGANPYEVTTNYPYCVADDLWAIQYAQDDEKLYLVHPLYPPMILEKGTGDTNFTLTEMDFKDGPYEDAIDTPTITPSAVTGNITLTASGALFYLGHVGAFWRILNGATWGYVIITAYTSPTVVSATVVTDLAGYGASTSHMEGAWSDLNGWPRTVCFNEGRLLFGGNYEHPQTIWASKTGDYTDFTPGTDDAAAYSFTFADLNIIRWIASGRNLSIGALNGEVTAIGPSDGPITAADPPTIRPQTTHGSSDLAAPVRVGKSILFLQRAARKIREFSYSYADDAYGAADVTIASEHLFTDDIIDMVYQQEPISILWAIRNDGALLSCTYDRNVGTGKGGIVAWANQPCGDGLFLSIATIPYEEQDQLWAIISISIGGLTKRYVEYYDTNICVDHGLTWSGAAVTTLSGLDHLNGKEVQIVGDGAVHPPQTIPASGSITITPAASEIYVGVGYTPTLITNRPEVQGAQPTQGLVKGWAKLVARVIDTMGLTINGQLVPAREPIDPMDTAPPTFTGDVDVNDLGWDTDGRITIVQALPLPAHVVSISGALIIGDA